MTEPPAANAKILSLEGLRGVMAWWVVLGHISLSFGWHLPLIDRNALAVDVFIILSGFVIARLIDRKGEPYGQYITRRACRLFPLYLIVLAVSTLLLPVQLAAWSGIPFATPSNTARVTLANQALSNLAGHVGIHVPLLQGLLPLTTLPGAAYTIVGQAWSISLEWQFYLLAPLFVWALAARRRWPLLLVAVVILCIVGRSYTNAFLGARILHFCIGMCCYCAIERRAERPVWAGLVGVLYVAVVLASGTLQLIPLAIWGVVLLSAAAPSHHLAHRLAGALAARPLVHFGAISYSLYLVHMIPLYGSVFLLGRLGASRATYQIVATLATILGAYLIARVMYVAVEQPGIALGARLARRQFGVAPRPAAETLPLADTTR